MNAADLHANGIHTECKLPAKKWAGIKYLGNSSHSCAQAGSIEDRHTHDFDGPLWAACGCEEFSAY